MSDYLRGHKIHQKNGEWFYTETGEPTVGNRKPCGYCGKNDTPEDHDGCLGHIPGAINACCGHGREAETYVQFSDGIILRGLAAQLFFQLKRQT